MTGDPAVYWLVQTGADVPGDGDWLTRRELRVLEELQYVKRRADWRLGRWTAKRAVRLFGVSSGESPLETLDVEIVAAPDGAPEVLVKGLRGKVVISISHSSNVGFCALSPDSIQLGCDVETVGTRSDKFVSDYFTSGEAKRTMRAPRAEYARLATVIWSAKESALKAMRVGLGRDTRSVEVVAAEEATRGEWGRLRVECRDEEKTYTGWWRCDDSRVYTLVSTGAPKPPLPLE